MSINKLNLYYQTLKHVKPTQLYHQVYFRLKNKFYSSNYNETPTKVIGLAFSESIYYADSYLGNNKFSFLNLEQQFEETDWNYASFGKLWTYNLNYFEFLNQRNISKEQGVKLIRDYCAKKGDLKDGLEPYPISLRGINWIKFIAGNKISDPEIDKTLYNDYLRLTDNLEYHLLANHLLENGFSLLFGAYYFEDKRLYKEAKKILQNELEEQILKHGAHYELSPMYHQIILHRVLDSYNLVKNNLWNGGELLPLLKEKSELMFGWLEQISFRNGDTPKLNDASNGIASGTKELLSYAEDLGLKSANIELDDSGYRKFENGNFEIVMDVGQIAPSYQPGHSHADSLQFVLNFKDKPIIVDTGISTYEKNERRQLERSTSSHNTVTINELNSSNVWGGFRVAERAKVSILQETKYRIEASHNGYRQIGITHKRAFNFPSDKFEIGDEILGKVENAKAKGHLHFHPDVLIEIDGNSVLINGELKLEISGTDKIELVTYQFAEAFNKLKPARKIEYIFNKNAQLCFHAANAKKCAADRGETVAPVA